MKTIPFPQFCGKDSVPFSSKADCQVLWCLYRETIQSGDGDTDYVLYKTPGLLTYVTPAVGCHRGAYELNDYIFDVVDSMIYLFQSDFSNPYTFGPIMDDGLPVVMAASPDTLLIVSDGVLYRINSAALTTPATPAVPISCAYIDGYFVILSATNQLFWSTDDGATWNALDFQTAEGSPSFSLAMIVDHNELWLVGNRVTQVFTVGTDPNAPFVPRQDANLPQGIAAPASLVAQDDSLFMLGRNKQGDRTIVRMNGYTPVKVSTYAVENALRKLDTVDDCIGMAFQLNGHSMVWFTFPSAPGIVGTTLLPGTAGLGQTFCYDATENDWYRIGYWNAGLGEWERHRANCIVSAFDRILVGDFENGNLYKLSPDLCTDDGNPIRWLRRTPHVRKDNKNVGYSRFEVTCEVGVPCVDEVAPAIPTFAYYSDFIVKPLQVPSTQTNFPVGIVWTDARFKSVANGGHVESASGFDLRPYDAAGTTPRLFELVWYDPTTGSFEMWVLMSSIDDLDTIRMRYGNPSLLTDGSSPSTWPSTYKGVWHYGSPTVLALTDSTSNGNDGVGANTPTAAAGPVGGAVSLDLASSQYVEVPDSVSLRVAHTDSATWEFWVRRSGAGGLPATQILFDKRIAGAVNTGWVIYLSGGNPDIFRVRLTADDGAGDLIQNSILAFTITADWTFFVVTYDGSGLNTGLNVWTNNGAAPLNRTGALSATCSSSANFNMGRQSTGTYFDGKLDEMRMSKGIARSNAYALTSYNNQVSMTDFWTLDTEVVI